MSYEKSRTAAPDEIRQIVEEARSFFPRVMKNVHINIAIFTLSISLAHTHTYKHTRGIHPRTHARTHTHA